MVRRFRLYKFVRVGVDNLGLNISEGCRLYMEYAVGSQRSQFLILTLVTAFFDKDHWMPRLVSLLIAGLHPRYFVFECT